MYKKIIITYALLITGNCFAMGGTFVKTATIFPKTRFATPGLTSFDFTVSRSKATESFDTSGKKAPLLSFHGPEDLLNRFIDTTLPYNDTTKVGQALFHGIQKTHEYTFTLEKNFNNNIFLDIESSFLDIFTEKICIAPVSNNGTLLTKEEIELDSPLKEYLDTFNKQYLSSGNGLFSDKSSIPLFVSVGYAKNWQDFKHIDYINYSIQGGISTPSVSIDHHNPESVNNSPFAIPTHQRHSYGFPFQANVELGALEWLNIGACGVIIPFISNNKYVRLNPTETNNILLSQDNVLTTVNHKPFIYTNFYIEAEELIPKLTILLGLSYEKQFETSYSTCNPAKYPASVINNHSLHDSWQRAMFTLNAQIDFATEEKSYLPRLKFIYQYPFYGKSVYKAYTTAGQIGFDILARF